MGSSPEVTQLLHAWSEGDDGALQQLMPIVYDELHRLAQRYMSHERPEHTLQPTALVNEAYLRLVESTPEGWQSRAHFFAVSARVMRRILVDWARSRQALKHARGVPALQLQEELAVVGEADPGLVAIDDALKALASVDARKSQVIESRFFGGLSVKETAEVLKVSEETVHRDWKLGKSWLRRELGRGYSSGN